MGRASWFAGGLFGAVVAAAVSLYALGVEMVGEDAKERRVRPSYERRDVD